MLSAWLIGSRPWSPQTFAVNGVNTVVEAPLGGLYLRGAQAATSLVHRVGMAFADAGIAVTVELLRNRRVRLSAGAAFSVDWGTGLLVRDLLGFTGDLVGASAYVAPRVSELLWSPGKTEAPKLAPLGALGGYFFELSAQQGFGGLQSIRQHGPPTIRNTFEWTFVARDRYWTAGASAPGEYARFFRTTLIAGHRFMVWRKVDESDFSSETAALQPQLALGPYVLDLQSKSARKLVVDRSRGFGSVEARYNVEIDVIVQPEYSQT